MISNKEELITLAKQVEALDGPNRKVDALIAEAFGMCQHHNKTRSGYQDDTGFDCDDCGADSWGNRSKDGHNRRLYDPNPAYTTSLDAAMTLVPNNTGWCVSVDGKVMGRTTQPQAHVLYNGSKFVSAATPALALTAAALHACARISK